MFRVAVCLLIVGLAVLFAKPAAAAPAVEQQSGRVVEFLVYGEQGQAGVTIGDGLVTTLSFPGVEFIAPRVIDDFPFGLEKNGDVLSVWARPSALKAKKKISPPAWSSSRPDIPSTSTYSSCPTRSCACGPAASSTSRARTTIRVTPWPLRSRP